MQRKVLIIEDSNTSMRVLKHMVERNRLQAVCAASLVQAKHIFSSTSPEDYLCAVVDYNLPDAPDGQAIDFAINAFLPTIVITGKLDPQTRQTVLKKAVVDYIPKENAQVFDYLNRLLVRLEKNKRIGVLVVDDSRTSRSSMKSLLRRQNFITYEACDGLEGLQVLQEHNDIKLVITDENMPNMNGVEMVATLRKTHKKEDLSVIGISSDNSGGALSARFIKSGANDYLHKPFCHEEFLCRIMQNVESVENIETIRRTANTDYLTGLPNRRLFFNRVTAALRLSPKHACMAIIDIDFFKKINDSLGHDGGDKVLKDLAVYMHNHFSDKQLARFGGEEFCVFLLETKLDDAKQKLETFRKFVEQTGSEFDGKKIPLTISIGLTANQGDCIEAMIKNADLLLYKAKENGRNQVVCD